jgi:hypothetical protein
VIGDGAEFLKSRGGQTHLCLKKNTYLKVSLKGLRHEKLKPNEEIPRYTLTVEFRVTDAHRRLTEVPWSLFQASFPDPHATDELTVQSEDRPYRRKWKVLTKENKCVVTAESDPNSRELGKLVENAIVTEDGLAPKRLPTGERRLRVRYKVADVVQEEEKQGLEAEEYVVELEVGYFGNDHGNAPTSVMICSNKVVRTVGFCPGSPGGKACVNNEPGIDMGWTPRDRTMHLIKVTMRKSGWHTFQITDGDNPQKTWSKDFRVLGWLEEKAFVQVMDPDDEDVKIGEEHQYHNSGLHKLRLFRKGNLTKAPPQPLSTGT